MSKIPVIGINGSDVPWSAEVNKLRTGAVGGGNVLFIPSDEVGEMGSLDVDENGTYDAATEGKYGYSYVTVSVPGASATGKGSDGKMHRITVDVSTGYLQDTVLD